MSSKIIIWTLVGAIASSIFFGSFFGIEGTVLGFLGVIFVVFLFVIFKRSYKQNGEK